MKKTIFSLLLLCVTFISFPQLNFSVHYGAAFPLADFTSYDDNDDGGGGAAVGSHIGLQCTESLKKSGLGLFVGLDIIHNGLKKDVKDDFKQMLEDAGIWNANYKFYKYLNIPISGGLSYTFKADEKISLFTNLGLTYNFLKITDMVVNIDNEKLTMEFDLTTGTGFKIGGGILINDKFSVAVNYLGLGEHDIKGVMKTPGTSEDISGKQKVDILTLTLGFKF